MKFDYAIGNPPYHEEKNNESKGQPPIYHIFMDETHKVAKCTELITPARFLFNAGLTPKKWNKQILNDEHFKVLEYEENALNIFPNTKIKGGVSIHIRNENRTYGAIKEFIPYPELKSIIKKIQQNTLNYFHEIVTPRGLYKVTSLFFKDIPKVTKTLNSKVISTNFFEKLSEANIDIREKEREQEYIEILYKPKNKEREIAYMKKEYIQTNNLINTYNVAYPKAAGEGKYGEKQ